MGFFLLNVVVFRFHRVVCAMCMGFFLPLRHVVNEMNYYVRHVITAT